MSLLLLMVAAAQIPKSHLDDIHGQHICPPALGAPERVAEPWLCWVEAASQACWHSSVDKCLHVPCSLPVSEIGMSVCGN